MAEASFWPMRPAHRLIGAWKDLVPVVAADPNSRSIRSRRLGGLEYKSGRCRMFRWSRPIILGRFLWLMVSALGAS
jgi:hypothetical protein